MSDAPKISEAEWEVMQVLWEEAPLAATEVFERLEEHGWKLNTVRTFLTRLEQKKALKAASRDGVRVFSPAVTREACLQGESKSFVNRFFRGAAGALLMHFAEQTKLSDRELVELEKILKEKRKGGGRGNR